MADPFESMPPELLTAAEMGQADQFAVGRGVPSLTLMENAGRAVAGEAAKMVPWGARIAVLCGPGNNGGDGYVAARVLKARGYDVRVLAWRVPDALKGDAAEMARRWLAVAEVLSREDAGQVAGWADLIVDGVFGAGLDRPLAPGDEGILRALAEGVDCRWLAIDVPSGVNGTTGQVLISGGYLPRAQRTVTFHRLKTGHVLLPGRALCGEIVLADIGIPDDVVMGTPEAGQGPRDDRVHPRAGLVRRDGGAMRLALARETNFGGGHKYAFGHTLVASGPAFQTGAARLSARAALRIGSGLVTIAAPHTALPEHAAQVTAIMLLAFADGQDLARLLGDTRKNAVVAGPGFGVGADTCVAVLAVLGASCAGVVLDADALTSFAEEERLDDLFKAIAARVGASEDRRDDAKVVLTPHAGEFQRLFPDLTGDKVVRARLAASRSGAVVVLKGADTVIARPSGDVYVATNAPPWLATAGSGDVLAGLIAGAMAQGLPAFDAACACVWLHGACGNLLGPGLIAEDLPEVLPEVLADLRAGAR